MKANMRIGVDEHVGNPAGIMAYGATEVLKVPAPLVVIGGGVCGVIGWGANMH